MVQIYIYVFVKIPDLGSLCKMEHFVSKLGRLLLFEGISCTCYFTTGVPAKRVSQLVVDLRLLEYCKIKQGILQQILSKYYRFEREDTLCEYFNKFINTLKGEREQKEPEENYPWLVCYAIIEAHIDMLC